MSSNWIDKILQYRAEDSVKLVGSSNVFPVVVILLIIANWFMANAWYHHLKDLGTPFLVALGISLLYVVVEYIFNMHANIIGKSKYSLYTLKIIQEAVTLSVFMVYAWVSFGEPLTIKHAASFGLIFGAVGIAFYD